MSPLTRKTTRSILSSKPPANVIEEHINVMEVAAGENLTNIDMNLALNESTPSSPTPSAPKSPPHSNYEPSYDGHSDATADDMDPTSTNYGTFNQYSYTLTDDPNDKLYTGTSNLVPVDRREIAVLGTKNEALLHIRLKHRITGRESELSHRIPRENINWNSKLDIAKINSWRRQIFNRAGMQSKEVIPWHSDEEMWFDLYMGLLMIQALSDPIEMPSTKETLADFNAFFVGKVLIGKDGNDLDPREERTLAGFTSKYNRLCAETRNQHAHLLCGGKPYRPNITYEMFKVFKSNRVRGRFMTLIPESKGLRMDTKAKSTDVTKKPKFTTRKAFGMDKLKEAIQIANVSELNERVMAALQKWDELFTYLSNMSDDADIDHWTSIDLDPRTAPSATNGNGSQGEAPT